MVKFGWNENKEQAIYNGSADFRYSIHHYIGCGDTWFVSCPALKFDQIELKSKDLAHAKEEAKALLIRHIELLLILAKDS